LKGFGKRDRLLKKADEERRQTSDDDQLKKSRSLRLSTERYSRSNMYSCSGV
jgi:hypothetical protein